MNTAIYMATGKVVGKIKNPKTVEAARKVASEGIVLLKNENALPLKGNKVAIFGAGAIDTFTCGTGSGYVFAPYTLNVVDGFKKNGYEVTSSLWIKNYVKYRKAKEKEAKISFMSKRWSGIKFICEELPFSEEEINEAKSTDTAIYTIHRNTGEGEDRKAVKGDYYLSDLEKENIRKLTLNFSNVIVVLNTCVIDAKELNEINGVKAIVLLGQAGMEAGNALFDVLTGKVSPSGRLTDTWAVKYEDYPASATYSLNDGDSHQEDYKEGIYVGYRYFDSFKKDVIYPFGYGLSYTSFAYENIEVKADEKEINISLDVKNTGNYPSKEVVQVYVSAPNGKLAKAYQELKGYEKTNVIKPNESEKVTITIPASDLASYDEETSSYVLEKGTYLVRLGNNSRNTKVIAKLTLNENAITCRLKKCLTADKELNELKAGPFDFENPDVTEISLDSSKFETADFTSKYNREITTYVTKDSSYKKVETKYPYPFPCTENIKVVESKPNATLTDVKDGKVTIEEFIASLDYEVLVRLVTGTASETPYPLESRYGKKIKSNGFPVGSSGKTTKQYVNIGIPGTGLCDGPAGLHLMGSPTTGFPVGLVTASTWNKDAAYLIGDCFGIEMDAYNLGIILGPGMNIHRDPLCGRNFEYYSEDPFLTGKTAAGFIKGVQENHPGRGVSCKHFAGNNQENDRTTGNDSVSERTLREIYLKGFEIAVKEANPLTVMSSYNCINGIHTSSRYDLLTDVLKTEWGFKGYVMTDWDSASNKVTDLYAGNDIIMGGYQTPLITQAITGADPVFEENGSVKTITTTAYGGFFKKTLTYWNSFVPSKDGKDTYEVNVKKDVTLSENIKKFEEEGFAEVKNNEDGSKTIIYHGTKNGVYLPLGVLQRNAIRLLNVYMNQPYFEQLRKINNI